MIKIYVKTMRKKSEGFFYLRQKFLTISEAELKKEFSLIYKLQSTKTLVQNYILQKETRKAFENVCSNFLDNEKTENYSESVQTLISSYSAVACTMSLKLHFLLPIWIFFPENMRTVFDEPNECFHQDISQIEKWYTGK